MVPFLDIYPALLVKPRKHCAQVTKGSPSSVDSRESTTHTRVFSCPHLWGCWNQAHVHTLGLFIAMETPYNPSSGGISSGQQLRPKCACGFLRLQAGHLQSSFIHLHLQWERLFLLCSYDETHLTPACVLPTTLWTPARASLDGGLPAALRVVRR